MYLDNDSLSCPISPIRWRLVKKKRIMRKRWSTLSGTLWHRHYLIMASLTLSFHWHNSVAVTSNCHGLYGINHTCTHLIMTSSELFVPHPSLGEWWCCPYLIMASVPLSVPHPYHGGTDLTSPMPWWDCPYLIMASVALSVSIWSAIAAEMNPHAKDPIVPATPSMVQDSVHQQSRKVILEHGMFCV